MAIILNDNIDTRAGKPTDNRFGTTLLGTTGYYTSVTNANNATPSYQRYIGLTVGIKSGAGPIVEYWYANGIANADLVQKVGSVVGASNGLAVATGGNIVLGGTLTQATTITTSPTTPLNFAGLTTNNTPTNILVTDGSGNIQQATYSTLLTNISNSTIGNLTVNNGLTKTGTTVKLGGTLLTNTAIELSNFALIFQNKTVGQTPQSEFTFSRNLAALDTFDNIAITPAGSRSRIISFRSSTAMWTTNYQYNSLPNPAYNAFTYWLTNVKPWIPAEYPSGYPSGVAFQILENMVGTNADSSLQAHYFDERVSKPQWSDTWIDTTTPNAFGSVFPGWISGKTYTIRSYEIGDDFTGAFVPITGVRSGTLNTTGFTFISNGVAPAVWINNSVIDGDFPITDLDERTAYVTTTEEDDPLDPFYQKGIVRIQSNATYIDGYVDQGNSSRGLRLAIIDAGAPLPTSAVVGEMFYRVDDASIVFKVDNVPTWKKVNTTTTT
jgi:hypothetical protein